MQSCYFLGGASHTSLGNSLATQVEQLHRTPALPGSVTVNYADKTQTLPYKLLADCDVDDADLRLQTVIDRIIDRALEEACITKDQRTAMGIFMGTSSFNINAVEQEYRTSLQYDQHAIPMATCSSQGIMLNEIRKRHGIRGPDFSFNTACTASANALIHADAMIRSGTLQHAIVLGVEMCNAITALGFHGLQLLSPHQMKPFDPARNGLTLGEGVSAVVLGNKARKQNRWYLKGAANLCDTHSVSATNPDGSVIYDVITQALSNAGLTASEIHAIKVHGTASLLNDEAEAAGMQRVFEHMPPLAAIKPFIGHTLGACGLNELLLFCGAMDQGFLIATPSIGDNRQPTANSLNVSLNQTECYLSPGNFLMNYFGFGGNNTSLVISNLDA